MVARFAWLFVLVWFANSSLAQPPAVGVRAEWEPARLALVHEPGEELLLGVLHPPAALFERTFSTDAAAREHRQWQQLLRERGVEVLTLRDAALRGTLDEQDRPVAGPALDRLRTLALNSLMIDCRNFPDAAAEQVAQAVLLQSTLAKMHPRDLWRTILQQPRVILTATPLFNTGYSATYEVRPLMNLYFLRDQLITTARGVVVGRMNSEQRAAETEVIELALANLEIAPVAIVASPGRLEGGDFLPAGERVFIGQGLRTNAAAIAQLLAADAFGVDEVVVVKDAWQRQEQMHLDTYFNLAAPDVCVLAENRVQAAAGDSGGQRLVADIHRRGADGYELARADVDFVALLQDELHMIVIPVSAADQAAYGVNFLAVRPRHVGLVNGVSDGYLGRLRAAGVSVDLVDFANLTGGYGACHCTVQVLRRGER